MIRLYDVQNSIMEALESDPTFASDTLAMMGKEFTYEIDLEEIQSAKDFPLFVIHKSFSLNTIDDVDAYAIQFNMSAILSDRVDSCYPTIRDLEVLAHEAILIADTAVCQYGLIRTTVKQFVTEIGEANDVEWIVLIGYMTQSDNFL